MSDQSNDFACERRPNIEPIIAAIMDTTIPIPIISPNEVVQKESSNIAGSRFSILQRMEVSTTL
jgi:hypothetical protein